MNVHLTQGNHSTPDQNLQAEDINHRKKNMDDAKNDPPQAPTALADVNCLLSRQGKGTEGKRWAQMGVIQGIHVNSFMKNRNLKRSRIYVERSTMKNNLISFLKFNPPPKTNESIVKEHRHTRKIFTYLHLIHTIYKKVHISTLTQTHTHLKIPLFPISTPKVK